MLGNLGQFVELFLRNLLNWRLQRVKISLGDHLLLHLFLIEVHVILYQQIFVNLKKN